MTIDRIIFLRICEDRGIEDYGTLQNLIGKPGVYRRLMERFQDADKRYNSGLFDFRKDTITPSLKIDDKLLSDILSELYPPKSPYEFSVIGIEILGEVYEQFLGKVIRLTAGIRPRSKKSPKSRRPAASITRPPTSSTTSSRTLSADSSRTRLRSRFQNSPSSICHAAPVPSLSAATRISLTITLTGT